MPRTPRPTFDVRTWRLVVQDPENRDLHRALRRIVGDAVYRNTPVEVVEGDVPPHREGAPCYYTSRGGKSLIFDPIAYAQQHRRRLKQHPPTLRIVVGTQWLDGQRKFRNRATKLLVEQVANQLTYGVAEFDALFI